MTLDGSRHQYDHGGEENILTCTWKRIPFFHSAGSQLTLSSFEQVIEKMSYRVTKWI